MKVIGDFNNKELVYMVNKVKYVRMTILKIFVPVNPISSPQNFPDSDGQLFCHQRTHELNIVYHFYCLTTVFQTFEVKFNKKYSEKLQNYEKNCFERDFPENSVDDVLQQFLKTE